MSDFLEKLRERHADAQKRLTVAQLALQKAQQEHANVAAEFNSWNFALAAEQRREQAEAAARQGPSPTIVASTGRPQTPVPVPTHAPAQSLLPGNTSANGGAEQNKTNLIRESLQRHPAGMKPVEVWKEVRDQVARPYVYSVLSRMKEKKQVIVRRGKYFLQITEKSEEA
jgi:hypothetical protein